MEKILVKDGDQVSFEYRNGTYAICNGKEYKAGKATSTGKIVLFSQDPKDEDNGFIEMAEHKYKKEVEPKEIETAYMVLTYAQYQGFKFQIDSVKDGKACLVHSGNSGEIDQLGFEWIEPHVYEKVVSLEELDRIFEEKTPIWGF